jgi:penicillin-binding protein 2
MQDNKQTFLVATAVAIAITVVASVFRLAFVRGEKFDLLSDRNRVRTLAIFPKRGTIYDRYSEILAKDIKSGEKFVRKFEIGEEFGPVIGYIGESNPDDRPQNRSACSEKSRDRIGLSGVESTADCILGGESGTMYIEVNSKEAETKKIETIWPKDGDDIKLSIDAKLQKKAFEAFDGLPGAAIVMMSGSSDILALVSSPSFDPSLMGLDMAQTEAYLNDSQKPLFNRAISGTYPPGSVFKMVVATAILQDDVAKDDEQILDTGYKMVGKQKYTNWFYTEYAGRTDGEVNMVKALKRSNDIYFYEMGERLGVGGIAKYAHIFGYGSKTGIEIDQEQSGVVPTEFWKEETLGDKWYLGDTYNYSIGQGYMLATPIQVAQMTQIISGRGNYCEPSIFDYLTRIKFNQRKSTCHKAPIARDVFEPVINGMVEACSSGGTAWTFFDINSPDIATTPAYFKRQKNISKIACKTGTAEHPTSKQEKPHSWLTLFAPYDKPKIIITVLVEKGGQGSDVAGKIAREIFDSASDLGYLK